MATIRRAGLPAAALLVLASIALPPRPTAGQTPPEAALVESLIGTVYLELCFTPRTVFTGQVLDAGAARANGQLYAFVLMELSNRGPDAANSASAVLLIDQDFNGGRMTADVPDEDDYYALAEELGAITPFDVIDVRETALVLFVFVVPPGAQTLALSPNPFCYRPDGHF